MGISALWIITSHMVWKIPILESIENIGFIGVDIFLYLSGIGLVFSIEKSHSYKVFFKNRSKLLIRFLPFCFFFILLNELFFKSFNYSFCDYLALITTIGFWKETVFLEWYTPSIIFLYCLFPILYHIIKNYNENILLLLSIIAAVIITLYNYDYQPKYMLYSRFPIFISGIIIGKKIYFKEKSDRSIFLLLLSGIAMCFLFHYYNHNNIFFFLRNSMFTPLLLILIISILKKTDIHVLKFLYFCGKMSYEIFLGHMVLFIFKIYRIIPIPYIWIVSIITACLFYYLNIIIKLIIDKITTKKIK